MAKVINRFYCRITDKRFKVGDEYTGDRKDLANYLELEDKKAPVAGVKKAAKKAPKKTTKKAKKK
jgi:hypothetical protein